jgi:hypothetical protein
MLVPYIITGRMPTTTEELSLEVHLIEGVNGLVIVGLDLSCWRE